jgi:hypothetical protein
LTGEAITGETVTGEATAQQLIVITTIIEARPTLLLTSPKNEIYLTNNSILLKYTYAYADTLWYNIDSDTNTTLSSSIYFNTTEGLHTLNLYANNSYGITKKSINFNINSSKLIIYYNQWQRGQNKGNSTDFYKHTFEELQNFERIILENTNKGKILFNQPINLIDDENPTDGIINLDDYISITHNRIEIDSTTLPNFNKSATISLYNLNFSNPRILKDGAVCSSEECIIQDYSNGNLVFNVTGFTVYSAEENSTEETPRIISGNNGIGGSSKIIDLNEPQFSVDIESIKVKLSNGETTERKITITNLKDSKIKIKIAEENLANFIKISETEFELEKDESKIIIIDFIAKETAIPNLYLGKIIIEGDISQEKILTIIEIESKNTLFDVIIERIEKSKNIFPGGELLMNIKLQNLGATKRIDAEIEFIILDQETNKEIFWSKETIAVETQINLFKNIPISKDIPKGKYIAYVRVTYNGKVASAMEHFNVKEKPIISLTNSEKIIIYGIIIFLLSMILIYLLIKNLKIIKKKIKKKTTLKKKEKSAERLIEELETKHPTKKESTNAEKLVEEI